MADITVNDLLKRLNKEDYDKVIIISDDKGWTNIKGKLEITESSIILYEDNNTIFSDDKETWIKENINKFSLELVREFMTQYNIDTEDDARRGLAECYYYNMFG